MAGRLAHPRRVPRASEPAVVGVADHSGWANLVTVTADGEAPAVVDRRRCQIIDADLPRQPYHAATALDAEAAEHLIARVVDAACAGAGRALDALLADLGEHRVVALTLRSGGDRPLPGTVAGVLASHSAMHAAEGQIYRDAWADAADERGIAVALHPRGDALGGAAALLGTTAERLGAAVSALGRQLGPPWQREHREATAAALGELAQHTPVALGG
jgi:hypothetical protein